jgi:hypothetical protein
MFPRTQIDGQLTGGLSGLEWHRETNTLISLSDRDDLYRMPMQADQDMARIGRIKLPRGLNDPEALHRGPGDKWIVSFEQGGGIAWYEGDAEGLLMRPARVLQPKAIKALPQNAGIEALAVLDFGRLLVISEGGSGDLREAWIIDDAELDARKYPVSDGFEPVDAALLPNGDLLVLARRFNGFLPPFFSARIAYIAAATLDTNKPITAENRISLKGVITSENWEGLAIAEDQGRMVIWLVSDDNQKLAAEHTVSKDLVGGFHDVKNRSLIQRESKVRSHS